MSELARYAGYNGWSNYETWVVNLWLNNDEVSYYALEEIKTSDESEHNKAERLEELVRELYGLEQVPVGIAEEFVRTAFAGVDWREIVLTE